MSYFPGPGDARTWGAVWHPNDPRQDDLPDAPDDEPLDERAEYEFFG